MAKKCSHVNGESHLLFPADCDTVVPCISNRSPTETHRPRSCCARAIAKPTRSRSAPSPTCPIGRPRSSKGCAPCSRAARWRRPIRKASSWAARCRTAMSRRCWALRNIGLDRMLGPPRNRCRDLVIAMIVVRLIAPASKLATARMLDPLTASSSLGEVIGLGPVDEDELYVALDWLGERQEAIEKALARKHLHDGTLVLYDVSSSYVEGRCCELAQLGYNRDGKKGKLQIVYGLLCAADGCPVAIEVFEGDTGDPRTLAAQIAKLKERFGLAHVVLVGDRGLITQARIDADLAPAGLDWITALRAPALRALVEGGALQLSLFDQRDLAAITSPDYPGERLIV